MIKEIYEAGLSQLFYYAFFGIGFLATYGFLIWYRRKLNIKVWKVVFAEVMGSVFVLCVMGVLKNILTPLANKIPIMNSYLNNMGRSFVFVPIAALVASWILRISWAKISNLYSFSQTILWGCASLGCLFPGCCRGYPCEWGIYNVETETRLFPTQIVNSVALLSIAVYIYQRCKKRQYEPDGKEYPIMLILVGIIRFSTEFLMDNKKIIFGLSSLSFDALGMILVGVIMFIAIKRKESKDISLQN